MWISSAKDDDLKLVLASRPHMSCLILCEEIHEFPRYKDRRGLDMPPMEFRQLWEWDHHEGAAAKKKLPQRVIGLIEQKEAQRRNTQQQPSSL